MSQIGGLAAHWLKTYQSEACALRSLWGDVDIPGILYKYIPVERIGKGAPDSLRATQLLALNDDMECNVTTMKGSEQGDTLAFLAMVQSKLEGHLGIEVPWEELLERSIRYGDLRLSTFIPRIPEPESRGGRLHYGHSRSYDVGPLRAEHRHSRGIRHGDIEKHGIRIEAHDLLRDSLHVPTIEGRHHPTELRRPREH